MTTLSLLRAAVIVSSLTSLAVADEPKSEPKPPSFDLPKGWKKVEGKAAFVAARFEVGEGEQAVVITMTELGPVGNTLAANVNRWRGQVGLKQLDDEEAIRALRATRVGSLAAHMLDVTGGEVEGKAAQRVIAIVIPIGEKTWYVRIGGRADLVAKQKANFEQFVKSIRFEK